MLERAARNLPGVKVLATAGVNVYDMLAHEHLVMTTAALKSLEERLSS
ncbi:MAG: 50S ribosomal protein L4 [Candidatus Binatia bacterium]